MPSFKTTTAADHKARIGQFTFVAASGDYEQRYFFDTLDDAVEKAQELLVSPYCDSIPISQCVAVVSKKQQFEVTTERPKRTELSEPAVGAV